MKMNDGPFMLLTIGWVPKGFDGTVAAGCWDNEALVAFPQDGETCGAFDFNTRDSIAICDGEAFWDENSEFWKTVAEYVTTVTKGEIAIDPKLLWRVYAIESEEYDGAVGEGTGVEIVDAEFGEFSEVRGGGKYFVSSLGRSGFDDEGEEGEDEESRIYLVG